MKKDNRVLLELRKYNCVYSSVVNRLGERMFMAQGFETKFQDTHKLRKTL